MLLVLSYSKSRPQPFNTRHRSGLGWMDDKKYRILNGCQKFIETPTFFIF